MSFRSAAARSHATLRNQRLLEIGATAKLDGEDDAGEHGGGAHDVLGDMACDRRGDGTADDAAQAHGDGERPVDGATADEHDRGGNVRAEADHGLQRVDLVERADLAEVEDRQGEGTGGGTEISRIDADEAHANPQPPRVVAQTAIGRPTGDQRRALALLRLGQRLRDSVACGRFLPRVQRDDQRAEQNERRHSEFEDLRGQFQQQQAADDASDQADASVDSHTASLALELLARGQQPADAGAAHAHRVRGVGQHRRDAERQQRRIGDQRGRADRVSDESRADSGDKHQQQSGDGHSCDHDRFPFVKLLRSPPISNGSQA